MTDERDRLSQITTLWSLVRKAHKDPGGEGQPAQKALLERYGGAVRRYLLAALRDEDAADEVFQEFALRFVRGDFRRADPERGRFRNFVKSAVYRLICDYQKRKRQGQRFQALQEDLEPAALLHETSKYDRDFIRSWRDELLARTWKALEERETKTGKPYHTVLKFRATNPDLRSPQLAEQLGARLGKSLTAEGVRQTIHRARTIFADLLLDEISHSLEEASLGEVENELIELNLMEYCKPAMRKRRAGS